MKKVVFMEIRAKNEFKKSIYCNEIDEKYINKEVTVYGWVNNVRNLGNLIFVNIRDRSGVVQLVFDETTNKDIFNKALKLRSEYVIYAKGIVRKRSSINKNIKTGNIEILVNNLSILSKAQTTPFEIEDNTTAGEDLRLKYRYLDLRRPSLQNSIKIRHKIVKFSRDFFDYNGFLEIETPMLIKSTPEGARDYLVPSRVFSGKFFALPQSPQLYKQLLMISGFDRYFQIARCFRDEDLRADRQPEFTQMDLEMSFVNSENIINLMENFIGALFKEILGIEVNIPFKRLTYKDAINIYGTDKPDTRYDLKLIDLTPIFKNSNFKIFNDAVISGGVVFGINAKNLSEKISRKQIDALNNFMKENTPVNCFSFVKVLSDGTSSSSFEKYLTKDEIKSTREKLDLKNGDIAFIVASSNSNSVKQALGTLRVKIADDFKLVDESKFNFLWVTDFPLLEFSKEENRYIAMHHPFTSPKKEDVEKLDSDPLSVLSDTYDIVLNGFELGGGSIRINNLDLQNKIFNLLGFSKSEIENRFGFLVNAFNYGVPPHGGIAIGLDRLCMLMLKRKNIRDVIAFPKVQSSADLMSNAPSEVSKDQLKELNIRTNVF